MQPPANERPRQAAFPFIVDQVTGRAGRPARLKPESVAKLVAELKAAKEDYGELLGKAFAMLDTLKDAIEEAVDTARERLGTVDHDEPEAEIAEALNDLADEVGSAVREARLELRP